MSNDHTPDSLSLCKAGEEYKWKPTEPVSRMFKNTNQNNTTLSKICSYFLPWSTDLHNDIKATMTWIAHGSSGNCERLCRKLSIAPDLWLYPPSPVSSYLLTCMFKGSHSPVDTLTHDSLQPPSLIKSCPLATLRPRISSAAALYVLG